jgi:plasmid stabilization system protein ParE
VSTKPITIALNATAKRQLVAAARWWKEQRGASSVIADAIEDLAAHLVLNPYLGQVVEGARRPDVRRFYLHGIGYHVFYRFNEQRARVVIVAIWHEKRRPLRL